MKKIILLFLFVLSFILFANAQTPDPGSVGTYSVTITNYDYGDGAFTTPSFPDAIEARARVFYPSTLSPGPFPLLIFLHGRHESCYNTSTNVTSSAWPCPSGSAEIPSYQGYDYLAQRLATQGYIVVSIGANSISATDNNTGDRGMNARAELIQYHLDLWKTFNTTGGSPFGNTFVGKVDLSRVGTMGHSRGGEGVVTHGVYNKSKGSLYGVKAILAVAPTNFNRPAISGIPLGVVLPYCDGDVVYLSGLHYYDDVRYLDPTDNAPKHTLLMMGANHNYYNTAWTPGLFVAGTSDDWYDLSSGSRNDPYCGTSSGGNKRYTDAKQRAALITYACAFFRVYVGGETQFAPILNVDDAVPPTSSTLAATEIHLSYHPPSNKRLDVNRTNTKGTETTNTLNDNVNKNGLANYDICGESAGNQYCLTANQQQEPHNYPTKSLSQLEIGWNSVDDWYENTLPTAYHNLTQFAAIQFRAAINFKDAPANQSLDFSVQLHSTSGATQSVKMSDYSNALFFPPGTLSTYLPRLIHNTIKIPMTAFNGMDISSIDAIRFVFDKSTAGAIIISDVMLSANSTVNIPPLAAFKSNLNSTCDGAISFTDNSINNPTQWQWDFGDGSTSTNQNPQHTYNSNGTYAVKLVVSNVAGADSIIKTSYITISRPAPTVTNGNRCGAGVVNLSATASSGGTLVWYDSLTGGSIVNTGTTYSPSLTASTNYYVQEEVVSPSVYGGKIDNTGGGGNLNTEQGLFFNVMEACTLKSVRVYAQGAGNRTIELQDPNGTVLQSLVVNIPTGTQTVILNFPLTPGNNYNIRAKGTINLYRNNAGVTYPYTVGTSVSITTSTATTTPGNYYYYFYDWEIQKQTCISSRVTVIGSIDVCTGIVSNNKDSNPKVYPNPAYNILSIEKDADEDKILSVEMINVLGEKVYSTTIENNSGTFTKSLNIEDVPAGIYFIYFRSEDKRWIYKLVKQ